MIKNLKYLGLTLLFSVGLSFITVQKGNTYTLTEGQMIMIYNANLQVKQILPTSQAPAIQVTNLNMSIDSIQKVLATQYNNFHPDATKPKK